jgi:hypothetical protein
VRASTQHQTRKHTAQPPLEIRRLACPGRLTGDTKTRRILTKRHISSTTHNRDLDPPSEGEVYGYSVAIAPYSGTEIKAKKWDAGRGGQWFTKRRIESVFNVSGFLSETEMLVSVPHGEGAIGFPPGPSQLIVESVAKEVASPRRGRKVSHEGKARVGELVSYSYAQAIPVGFRGYPGLRVSSGAGKSFPR